MKSNRCFAECLLLIVWSVIAISCNDRSHPSEELMQGVKTAGWITDPSSSGKGPSWLYEMPLVVAGGWDSEPATQRRWNDVTVDYMSDYEQQNSEETVLKLKEMGVTLVINHYFKGYGIKGEGKYMEDAAEFAALCHKHGLRVGAYIGNTLCYEQLLLEIPEAREWIVPDYMGMPVTYGGVQTFRMKPYIGHPGYQKYIKKVLKKAIVEDSIDFIHFDNSCSYGTPQNFHHPLAIEHFRDFLKKKYTPEQLEDRFDFSDVRYVVPPKYNGLPQPVQDPLFQEWTDFRCMKVGAYLAEMSSYIRELNPQVVVESNPHGVKGENEAWTRGIDWPRVLAPSEVFWCEGENEPGVMENGSLVSRIRTYKTGRSLGNVGLVQLGHNKLMMAEAMAYNQNCLGYIGARLSVYYWDDDAIRNVRYFHDNFQYYKGTRSIPGIAIMRTFPTMAYSSADVRYKTLLFEQTLIQSRIPFDILFDQQMDSIHKYKVLVLADQECMSDDQLKGIRKYVESGGGLVITGRTSLYNEWRRRRNSLGLRDLFTEDLPMPPGIRISQSPWAVDSRWYRHTSLIKELEGFKEESNTPVMAEFGKGRVIYIPEIVPGLSKPSKAEPTSQYWKMPGNYDELTNAVRWAAGGSLPVEIDAPPCVTMEFLNQEKESRNLIHLVNYDFKNYPEIRDIKVTMKLPEGRKAMEIKLLSPDAGTEILVIPFTEKEGLVSFTIPLLQVYDLIAVQFV